MKSTSKIFGAALVATGLAIGTVSAHAEDAMKKDSMKSDAMKSDAMKSDGMKKDGMSKNSKDAMHSNSMKKDEMKSEKNEDVRARRYPIPGYRAGLSSEHFEGTSGVIIDDRIADRLKFSNRDCAARFAWRWRGSSRSSATASSKSGHDIAFTNLASARPDGIKGL